MTAKDMTYTALREIGRDILGDSGRREGADDGDHRVGGDLHLDLESV